jgi:uncharacterized protein (DUF1778 family)
MPAAATKSLRTEGRLRPDQKRRIERAANLRGLSVSDFIVQHADQATKDIIQEETVWKLSESDHKAFMKSILNTPGPNAYLKAAAAKYKKGPGEALILPNG